MSGRLDQAFRVLVGAYRCQTCGRRVGRGEAVCPAHGLASLGSSRPEPESALWVEPPRVPGYHLRSVLGRGGFGTVFEAERIADGLRVALKVARGELPDAGARLLREIKAISDIGPPHVPRLYEAGRLADETPYFAMTHLETVTLADRLVASTGPAPLSAVQSLAMSMLDALEAVHARGYVHRDLKPDNIFVDDRGRATLIDLGLAATVGAARGEELTSLSDTMLGTPEYMAPEQCRGAADIDARADIYAMGVILYELLTGHTPFWGARAVVQECHVSRRPPRLAGGASVPPALEEAVLRCLAKEPHDRFPDVAALRASLVAALPERPPSSRPPEPPPPSFSPVSVSGGPPSASRQERRTVALVFFESDARALAVRSRLKALGAQLAYGEGGRYVALYSEEVCENPVRSAQRAAEELYRQGLLLRAEIDLVPVTVQTRADGSKRFLSTLYARPERYPAKDGPEGVTLTSRAAAVLPEASGGAGAGEGATLPAAGGSAVAEPSAELSMPPLVGRETVLASLLASARHAALRGVPSVASVVAEAGHGKSHLCRALVQHLRALDGGRAEVLELRAAGQLASDADPTLEDLVRHVLDLPARPSLRGDRAEARDVSAVEPVIAMALGWLAPSAPELRALTAAPGALRSALTTAVSAALGRRASARPLFVVLDDAHLAGDALLSALEVAALAEARVPLWICAFGRPEFEEMRPSFGDRAGRREKHRLGPLDPASAATLCRQLLAPVESVPDYAVQRLVERTHAIPLLLVELLRGLRRSGLVRTRPDGRGAYLATDEIDRLPDMPVIEWIAQRQIAALSPSLQAYARLIALLGAPVTIAELHRILAHLDRRNAAEALVLDPSIGAARLREAGVLARDARGLVRFAQALVREAFARSIPEPERRQMHLALFEYYRDADDAGGERWLSQVAFHAAEAGLGTIAESTYLTLAEQARARHAYVEAELLYSRALEQAVDGESALRGAACQGRGLMRYRVGRYDDALDDFARARAIAAAQGDVQGEVDILLDEAIVLDWKGEFRSSAERAEQARARLAGAASPLLEARLSLALGRSLHRLDREREAAERIERAAAQAERLGDDGYETLVISVMMLGFIYQGLSRLDDAQRALDRALSLCEEHGDTLHLMSTINNRAMLRAVLGDKEGMIADYIRLISLAYEQGNGMAEWAAAMNLGEILYLMDDLAAAEPHVQRAAAVDARRGNAAGRPLSALLEARLRYYQGQEDAAWALVAAIRAHQLEARDEGCSDALMVPSEEVLCAAVEHALRGASDAAWDALEARSAECSVGQEHVEVLELRALSALRAGRLQEARDQMEKALLAAERIPTMMMARLKRRFAGVLERLGRA